MRYLPSGRDKGIYYELASNKVLRNIEIFDFVIFREVLISYRNEMKESYIAFVKQIYRTSVSEYIAEK